MLKFFTPQLVTRNSQPSPPGSKKLAVDLGNPGLLKFQPNSCKIKFNFEINKSEFYNDS
jgi:hypothetical protein